MSAAAPPRSRSAPTARSIDLTAVDVGARLVCLEPDGKIVRVEEAGRRYGRELGLDLEGSAAC